MGRAGTVGLEGWGMGLVAGEGKAGTDFIAGAGGTEEAFVEKEFLGREGVKGGGGAGTGLESADSVGSAAVAGKSDVGVVGAGFRDEAAGGGGGNNALLEGDERGSEMDAGKEDAGAVKEAEGFELNGDGRGREGAKAGEDAVVLRGGGGAEELEGDVPGFGRGPAEVVVGALEARADGGELIADGRRERDGEEQAHGKSS